MTTSSTPSFLSEIAGGGPIPVGKRAYFQARLRNHLYDFVLREFLKMEGSGELTRADLARRIGVGPDRISKILGTPGNWTLDTVSDLFLGIMAAEPAILALPLANRAKRNYDGPDWIDRPAQGVASISVTKSSFANGAASDFGTSINPSLRIKAVAAPR